MWWHCSRDRCHAGRSMHGEVSDKPPPSYTRSSGSFGDDCGEDSGRFANRNEQSRLVCDDLAEHAAGLEPFAILRPEVTNFEPPAIVHNRRHKPFAMKAGDQSAVTMPGGIDQIIGREHDRGYEAEGGFKLPDRSRNKKRKRGGRGKR